jgi:hypothetical protein
MTGSIERTDHLRMVNSFKNKQIKITTRLQNHLSGQPSRKWQFQIGSRPTDLVFW